MKATDVDVRLPLWRAQRTLAVEWLVFSFVPIATLFVQVVFGNAFSSEKSGDLSTQAWQWLFPTLGPTLGLVLSVLAVSELQPEMRAKARRQTVSRFFCRIALGLSGLYIAMIAIMLFATTRYGSPEERLASLTRSRYLLGALSSLTNIVLGVFFVSAQERS
jgi:hypothetical protein